MKYRLDPEKFRLSAMPKPPPSLIEIPEPSTSTELWTPEDMERFRNFYLEKIRWTQLIKHPSVVLILGIRGSGKSALGYKLLECFRYISDLYVVALPQKARKLVPDYIGTVPTLENIPPGSASLADESYTLYHSRSSSSYRSQLLSNLINLSRHREQTLIFVTQEARQIDINIASSADVIIIKNPGILQPQFDRKEIRVLVAEAQRNFASINKDRNMFSYVYAQQSNFIGMQQNSLPSFWSSELSKAYIDIEPSKQLIIPGRMTREEKVKIARELRRQGFSLGQIAKILGVSKPTVKNYIDNYPYRRTNVLHYSN